MALNQVGFTSAGVVGPALGGVVIAQVDLTNNEELGVELGVQNNILYDRSLAVQ